MDQQTAILQQRIQVGAVGRRSHQPLERAARRQQKEQKSEVQQPQHAQHPPAKRVRQTGAAKAHGPGPTRQHQRPQQKGAFVPAPRRAETIRPRQRRAGVAGDVGNGEVVAEEGVEQRREPKRHAPELRRGKRRGSTPPRPVHRAQLPNATKRQGQHQRDDRGSVAQLDDHRATIARWRANRRPSEQTAILRSSLERAAGLEPTTSAGFWQRSRRLSYTRLVRDHTELAALMQNALASDQVPPERTRPLRATFAMIGVFASGGRRDDRGGHSQGGDRAGSA